MLISKTIIAASAGGAALLLAGGGAGYGWHQWTHSPKYSLKAVATAIDHHDRYQFEKYVDIDALLQSAATDLVDGNVFATAFTSAVVPQLKAQMIKAIEDGAIPTDSQLGKGIHKTLSSAELPPIDRQGRNAYFTIPITTKGGAPFALKMHMTQVADGYWRIDRVTNVKELKAKEDEEERARKAAIAKENEEKLAQLVVVAKLHTSITEGFYGLEKKNRFQVRFENKTDPKKTITWFSGHIRVPAQGFDQGIKATSVSIAPGETFNATWNFDVNRFIEDTVRVHHLGETDDFEVDIDQLKFSDGSEVMRSNE